MVLALFGIVQATVYRKTGRVGNASSDMDSIDGATLNDGDECRVFEGTSVFLWYRLDADSGVTPDDYVVIDPNDNPGSKRWILQDNSLLHYTQKNALDYGSAYTDATLQLAITDISTNHWTLLVNRGTWVIDADLTFAANTRLKFEEGAVFDINQSGTDPTDVVINGDIDAGLYQIFDVDANSSISLPGVNKFYPEWFGAVNDGTTDCYDALIDMAATVTTRGGGKVVFSEGTYFIDQYVTTANGNSDITFTGCDGLEIDLGGATIEAFGDFNRVEDDAGPPPTSSYRTVGFYFNLCNNLSVKNGTFDGNADQCQSGGFSEAWSHNFKFHGCEGVRVDGINSHHSIADGFYFDKSPDTTATCKRVVMNSCKSYNNARQGVSIACCRDLKAVGCEFKNTGRTGGDYPGHSPQAGVDIEPLYAPTDTDTYVEDIVFENCIFSKNVGGQLIGSNTARTHNVTARNCYFDTNSDSSQYGIYMGVRNFVLDSCKLVDTHLYPCYEASTGSMARIINCDITNDNNLILMTATQPRLWVEKNRFICDTEVDLTSNVAVYLKYNTIFKDNYVYVPAAGHDGTTYDIANYLQHCELVSGNIYDTDLDDPNTDFFANDYTGTNLIRDEYFVDGTYFRPSYASSKSTCLNDSGEFIYSRGYEEIVTIAAPVLATYGVTMIDADDNDVACTLGNGSAYDPGTTKLIWLYSDTNSFAGDGGTQVTITTHETEDSEVAQFDAVDEYLYLIWTGTEWATVSNSCTFP